MNTYSYSNIVDKQEIEALKEVIFKRARERAEAMAQNANTEYTSMAKNDVMEIARNSFVANKNPFSEIINTPSVKQNNESQTADSEKPVEQSNLDGLGFKQTGAKELIHKISEKNKQTIKEYENAVVQASMSDLQNNLSKKTSFMGALNFLNSQATESLFRSQNRNFDVTI